MTPKEQALFERYKKRFPQAIAVRSCGGRLTHIFLDMGNGCNGENMLCGKLTWSSDHHGDQSRPLCKACAKLARKVVEKTGA